MQLIKGTFKSKDAILIIKQLVDIKIKFHEEKINKSEHEEDIKMREKRIKELQKYLKETREELAHNSNEVNIDALINLNSSQSLTENFKLIEGTYEAEDAKSILLNAFNSKIQFHSHSAFGKRERGETGADRHENRIKELNTDLEKLKDILKDAEDSKRKISVSCMVIINKVDEEIDELILEQTISNCN